jgi:hypothetical protein
MTEARKEKTKDPQRQHTGISPGEAERGWRCSRNGRGERETARTEEQRRKGGHATRRYKRQELAQLRRAS